MLARSFGKIRTFRDHHFHQIVAGMRTLRPACDSLVTAAAANYRPVMRQIDEAVVQLVKDCQVKFRTTAKNRSTGLAPVGQNVFYDQIMLSDWLLPPNVPDQWGPATTVPNPGPVPQNFPLAYTPQAQNIPADHGNFLPPVQGEKVQCVLTKNVPNHHRKYLSRGQGVAARKVPDHRRNYPPRTPKVPAHQAITSLRPKGYRCKTYLIITGITPLWGKHNFSSCDLPSCWSKYTGLSCELCSSWSKRTCPSR